MLLCQLCSDKKLIQEFSLNNNKRDKSGWTPVHQFTQWTHGQVFSSTCTSCKYELLLLLFACCCLCNVGTMPQFTHQEVTFPFPVLIFSAYYHFCTFFWRPLKRGFCCKRCYAWWPSLGGWLAVIAVHKLCFNGHIRQPRLIVHNAHFWLGLVVHVDHDCVGTVGLFWSDVLQKSFQGGKGLLMARNYYRLELQHTSRQPRV